MKKGLAKVGKLLLGTLLAVWLAYVLMPAPEFPADLPNSPISREPGDVSDFANRKAYFTDMTREEIMSFYDSEFRHVSVLGVIPPIRIRDYPHEEAEWHVYTPLLSTHLEELVFPMRESLFVSMYEPGDKDDKIAYEGQPYGIKVTIRYYRSSVWGRLLITGGLVVAGWLVFTKWWQELRRLFRFK